VALRLALPGGGGRPAALTAGPAEAAVSAAPGPAPDRGEPLAVLALDDGTEFPLYEGVNTAGRRSTNQIVLADAFASGRHAEITLGADGTATLVDVGSTNGTFLAGERLAANEPVALEDGTSVTLGKTTLTFRRPAATPRPEEAAPPDGEETGRAGDELRSEPA
jgi:pSer/pThr/pTyr-binding forkhead associated (FHA) protein